MCVEATPNLQEHVGLYMWSRPTGMDAGLLLLGNSPGKSTIRIHMKFSSCNRVVKPVFQLSIKQLGLTEEIGN